MKLITSDQNTEFRELRDCLTGKGIRTHGLFLVSGTRAVTDTIANAPQAVARAVYCIGVEFDANGSLLPGHEPLRYPDGNRLPGLILAKSLFEELDVAGTHRALIVVRTPEIVEIDLSLPPTGLEVFCAMGDPANVGALLRSAAAFGANKVVLMKESASPFHPKAVRAASASTLSNKFALGPSIRELPQLLANSLTTCGPWIALDMQGESIAGFDWPVNVRLIIGEEGLGVPAADMRKIAISVSKNVESLNATVAASVALFSYRSRHPIAR